ncbi:hypothetical protein [Mycoplasma sp. P36-A1]|uniref:hypothetical protein n=1 Tax=Mycoplasma sp. P36-A1 TaxID=3252900 RepID=UPI003C2B1475
MKNIIKVLFTVLSILSFFVLVNYYDSSNSLKLNFEDTDNTKIYVKKNNPQTSKDYKKFLSNAAEINKVNIIIKEQINDQTNYYLNDKNKLCDFTNIKNKSYCSTFEYNNKSASIIPDFLNNDKVNYYNYNNYFEKDTLSTNLLVLGEQENTDDFYNFINKNSEYTATFTPNYDIDNSIKDITYFIALLILALTILIINIFSSERSSKEIYIKKMLGYNKRSIFNENVLRPTIIITIINIISTSILYIIITINSNFIYIDFVIYLVLLNLLNILLAAIVYFTTNYLINKKELPVLLKGQFLSKRIFYFKRGIYYASILLLLFATTYSVKNLLAVKNYYDTSITKWQTVSNTYLIPYFITTDDNFEFTRTKDFRTANNKVYKSLSKSGSIYADFSMYLDDNASDLGFSFATVNLNYINANNIKDYQNKDINVSNNKNKIIVTLKENDDTLYNKVNDYLKTSYSEYSYEIIKAKENQNYFSYNMLLNQEQGNYIKDPVLFIVKDDISIDFMGNAFGSNIAPFFMNDTSTNIDKYLKNNKISEYVDKLSYVGDDINVLINDNIRILVTSLTATLLLILIVIVVIIQNLTSYIITNKKEISLNYLLGFKLHVTFKQFIIDDILLLTIFASALYLSFPIFSAKTYFTILFSILLFNIFVTYYYLKRQFIKHILHSLKGGF